MSFLIIGGSQEDQLKKVRQIADGLGLNFSPNNPDILIVRPEKSIGIDQIRQIKNFLSQKSWGKGKKLVTVFQADSMTLPAQNAFLKTLEEPPANSDIILIADNRSSLLPTVISRCRVVTLSLTKRLEKRASFKKWQKIVAAPIDQRLALIPSPDLEELNQWTEDYLLCLQKELIKRKSQASKIITWLKLLLSARQMLDHNLSPQSVVDWLMIRL